jgi:hypothetical protein
VILPSRIKRGIFLSELGSATMEEIIFLVEPDPDGGFDAQALGHSIFIEGGTEEELKLNVLDAVKCHFEEKEDLPKIVRLHFDRDKVFSCA